MNAKDAGNDLRYKHIIQAFDKLQGVIKFRYLAHGVPGAGEWAVLFEKVYDKNGPVVPFEEVRRQIEKPDKPGGIFTIKLKKDQVGLDCCISPLSAPGGGGYLVLQKDTEFLQADFMIIGAFSELMNAAALPEAKERTADTSRFRSEILNMRYIQATLFPEFNDISGFDIGSVFFPSEHLSGNFIDGFFIDKTVYQITMCDISAKGLHSSFVGSAVRTLLRTAAPSQGVPSSVITEVNNKITRIIPGVKVIASMLVIQLNTRTGNVLISSNSGQPVFVYSRQKNRLIKPPGERPPVGGIAEVVYRDVSIQMDSGDGLLFYARGLPVETDESSGEQYGESRLTENYLKFSGLESKELVQSLAESVYEFINYTHQKDDIIITNIRRV